VWAVEKVPFNHKAHKEGSKFTKVRSYISALCVLCEILCDLCGYWISTFSTAPIFMHFLKLIPVKDKIKPPSEPDEEMGGGG
jgi:hypothetical protein